MSVERVACPHCGALNDPEAPRCLICGAALGPSAGPVAPGGPLAAAVAPVPPPGPPPAPWPAPRRSVGPVIALALGVVALCVVTVLGVGALALASGSGLPFLTPPTPTPVDPAQVLDRATAALADVQTMHYDMVVTFSDQPAATTPTVTLHLVGDVAFPDRYTMHTSEFGDLIVLGEDAYVRADPQERWARRLARDASPDLAPTNPTALPRFIRFARDPILDSTVVSGTLRLHKINFLLNTAQMVAEEGPASTGSVLSGSRVVCEATVGADDHRLYRLQLDLELRGNNKAAIQAVFSNFNAPVQIEAPTDLQP